VPDNAQQTVLGDRASREGLVARAAEPLVNGIVLNAGGIDQSYQDIHIEQVATHCDSSRN
jgi:hypothetical protein